MKQIINISITGSMFAALLGITACAPSQQAYDGRTNMALQNSDEGSTSGIIGGQPVDANDDVSQMTGQLYMVNPVKQKDANTGKETVVGVNIGGCTVSIISRNLVLTARHCLGSGRMFVHFAKDVVPENQKEAFFKGLATNPLVRHVVGGDAPELKGVRQAENRNMGDILILKLNAPIPAGFKVVSLLPTSFNLSAVKAVTLAGWGWTDGIKKTDTTTLRKVEVTLKDANYAETEILVGSTGKGACHGDSGGPAYVNVNGKNYLAGVTSRADDTDSKGECISSTIYTKTQFFNSWIVDAAKNLNTPKPVEQTTSPATVAMK